MHPKLILFDDKSKEKPVDKSNGKLHNENPINAQSIGLITD